MRTLRAMGGTLTATVLIMLGLSGCAPVTLSIDSGLYPSFQTEVEDYVSRCDASRPVRVAIGAPSGTAVSVGGQAFRSGTFTASVTRDVGQRFTIRVRTPEATTTHHVRCLPADFPSWTADRPYDTSAEFFVTAPLIFDTPISAYPVIFDTNGVPVWWGRKAPNLLFATMLPTGNLAWTENGVTAEHRLDGSLVRTYDTVGAPNDFHDLLVLPNGNHVMVTFSERPGVSLRAWGGPADATIIDHVVQEITPAGDVIWSWTTADHIPVTETTSDWREEQLMNPGGMFSDSYDPYHYNSIEATGDGFIISYRHLDAVYKVDKASGNIVWKLGGSHHPRRLTILDDPASIANGGSGTFGGQHDARLLGDGTVTLFDNGTARQRAPRAVRYRIDTTGGTATLLRTVTDPSVPMSDCCGSARVLSGGHYVIGWGGNSDIAPDIAESTRTGTRVFSLHFPDAFVYRAVPIPFGQLSRQSLRDGMDAQFPR
ncbi:MAG: aryl-sulfate sulfotransferase [Acidimicrobiales bacterium]